MPTYGFQCDDGCGHKFDISCSMDKIIGLKPKCPQCGKKKHVIRDFNTDIYIRNATPTTVGALAERNGARMSSDEMNDIKTKNRIQKPKFSGSLPEGGSLLPVDAKGNKIIPSKISKKKYGRPKNG